MNAVMLHLASIKTGATNIHCREALWSTVVQISMAVENATHFTFDSTREAGRGMADRHADERWLHSLGIRVDTQNCGLEEIGDSAALLTKLGTKVLSVDLYAGEEWVSGISDWGDEMDLLFSDSAWVAFSTLTERMCSGFIIDEIEAVDRPRWVPRP